MAAILCESISKLLRGTCDAVGTILTIPCKACGLATDQITNVCRSPFCLYLTVALGLNIPPLIFTARSYDGADCTSSLNWMYLNAFLCCINIIAAIYIASKICREENGKEMHRLWMPRLDRQTTKLLLLPRARLLTNQRHL